MSNYIRLVETLRKMRRDVQYDWLPTATEERNEWVDRHIATDEDEFVAIRTEENFDACNYIIEGLDSVIEGLRVLYSNGAIADEDYQGADYD